MLHALVSRSWVMRRRGDGETFPQDRSQVVIVPSFFAKRGPKMIFTFYLHRCSPFWASSYLSVLLQSLSGYPMFLQHVLQQHDCHFTQSFAVQPYTRVSPCHKTDTPRRHEHGFHARPSPGKGLLTFLPSTKEGRIPILKTFFFRFRFCRRESTFGLC